MWLDDIDTGGRGIVRPAQGPLGRALREARLSVFLSQAQLAAAVGTSQAAVSRLELGQPNWRLFSLCVDALGGRPVVTIEPVPTERDVWNKLFNEWTDYDPDPSDP